jgi:hypothetical protein
MAVKLEPPKKSKGTSENVENGKSQDKKENLHKGDR